MLLVAIKKDVVYLRSRTEHGVEVIRTTNENLQDQFSQLGLMSSDCVIAQLH